MHVRANKHARTTTASIDPCAALLKGGRSTIAVLALLDTAFFCGTPLTGQPGQGFDANFCMRLSFGR